MKSFSQQVKSRMMYNVCNLEHSVLGRTLFPLQPSPRPTLDGHFTRSAIITHIFITAKIVVVVCHCGITSSILMLAIWRESGNLEPPGLKLGSCQAATRVKEFVLA